jgi:hypothetical protein
MSAIGAPTAGCASADAPLPCGSAARRRRRRNTRDAGDPGRFSYDRRGEPPSGSLVDVRPSACDRDDLRSEHRRLPRDVGVWRRRRETRLSTLIARRARPARGRRAQAGRARPERCEDRASASEAISTNHSDVRPREDPPRWADAVEPALTHVQQDDVRRTARTTATASWRFAASPTMAMPGSCSNRRARLRASDVGRLASLRGSCGRRVD